MLKQLNEQFEPQKNDKKLRNTAKSHAHLQTLT